MITDERRDFVKHPTDHSMENNTAITKKLLFVASTRSHILQFHLPYLRQLAEEGWTIHVACGGSDDMIPHVSHVLSLPFKKRIRSWKNFQSTILLRRQLKTEQYTAIIVHTSLAAFFTRLSLLTLKHRPTVIHMVHGYLFDEQTPFLRRLLLLTAERLMAPVTDLLITMNTFDYRIAQKYGLARSIRQIPGIGVNFEQLDQQAHFVSPDVLRRSLGISPGACVLIYPAEFSQRKSQRVLLRAMTLLPEHVILVLPGIGICLDQCKSLANQLHLSHRVIFPGYVTNIGAWYAMADIAVSSSRSEGLPFSILEPMHEKTPIVASAVKGHVDLIHHKENGLLYPYGDWSQCAEQIRQLMNEPTLASTLTECAHMQADLYELSVVQPQVMELYRQALNASPSPAH